MRGATWILAFGLLVAGCALTPPVEYQRTADETLTSPYGAWVRLLAHNGAGMQGELLGYDGKHIYLRREGLTQCYPADWFYLVKVYYHEGRRFQIRPQAFDRLRAYARYPYVPSGVRSEALGRCR